MSQLLRPPVSPPARWDFPAAATHDLPNGLHVVTYDVPGQYVVSLRLAVPVPLDAEPTLREGVGTIMSRTLDEGTETCTAEQFARLLERKGVGYGAGVSDAGLSLDLDVVKGNLEPALELLRQIIIEPVFREAEVARHVRSRLAEIEQDRSIGANRSMLEFVRTFYAPTDRSSRPTGGSPETVATITRDDVAAHYRQHVTASGSTLVVAGDLGGLDVPALVGAALGGWAAGPDRARFIERSATLAGDRARVVLVDRPGAVQSDFLVGAPGPDRSAPGGWAPYPVLAYVLGGSPTARLDAVLREEKGYTYGTRSSFRPKRGGGSFLTFGSVRADVTAESIGIIVDILESGREGFSKKEVRAGVDYITKTAPGRFATADAIADEAVGMAMDGRTTEFTTTNLHDLATVGPERVTAAYERFTHLAGIASGARGAGWTIVVVGDASQHREPLEALGLGEITVVTDP